ncbi:MAG TPA: Tad domain-containing protein, partial [Levilinea sp.]|nr:Tad domain-containing protein [Levilinea sp.]
MKSLIDHRNESGQILLILTVGIVALLGMVALAVDGGMIYANRRFDQNAADASSFAGAGAAAVEMQNRNINSNNFNCTGAFNPDKSPNAGHPLYHPINNAINAALQRAASNNFTLQYPLVDQHGIEIICNSSGEKYLEVRTVISSNVRTAFAHLFYQGEVRNTVEAVARVATAYAVGGGASLTHLSKDCKTPLLFSGNSTAKIDGAWTNGCLRNNGTSLQVISDSYPVYHISDCIWNKKPGREDEWGCPLDDPNWPDIVHTTQEVKKIYLEDEHQGSPMNASQVRDFWNGICGTRSTNATFVGNKLGPGRYTFLQVTGGVNELTGGLYCIDGNFDVIGNSTLRSSGGVTIIMLGGSVDIRGTA